MPRIKKTLTPRGEQRRRQNKKRNAIEKIKQEILISVNIRSTPSPTVNLPQISEEEITHYLDNPTNLLETYDERLFDIPLSPLPSKSYFFPTPTDSDYDPVDLTINPSEEEPHPIEPIYFVDVNQTIDIFNDDTVDMGFTIYRPEPRSPETIIPDMEVEQVFPNK